MNPFGAGFVTGFIAAYLWPVAVFLLVLSGWWIRREIARWRFQRQCLNAVKQRNAGSGMRSRTSGAVQSSEKVEPPAGGTNPPGSTPVSVEGRNLYSFDHLRKPSTARPFYLLHPIDRRAFAFAYDALNAKRRNNDADQDGA